MLNTIVIQGRFTHNPEIRTLPSGTPMVSASVAVARNRRESDGTYATDFITCVFWGKTAELVANYFSKGDLILVRGRLQSHKYQDKEGVNRTSWEIIADGVDFCISKKEKEAQNAMRATNAPADAAASVPAAVGVPSMPSVDTDDEDGPVPF